MNVDETVEDAALRKFVEETGIAPHIYLRLEHTTDSKRDIRDVGKDKVRVLQLLLLVYIPLIKIQF